MILLLSSSIFYSQPIKKRDNCLVNYTYINIIILIIIIITTTTFDISVPLTSEMIAITLPCNITDYETLVISHVIYIWASNILWLHVNFIR